MGGWEGSVAAMRKNAAMASAAGFIIEVFASLIVGFIAGFPRSWCVFDMLSQLRFRVLGSRGLPSARKGDQALAASVRAVGVMRVTTPSVEMSLAATRTSTYATAPEKCDTVH